jgi:AraC-like DNA-binding protein
MLLSMPSAPALRPYVVGYWFVQDLEGVYEGRAIRTSPHPGAVLSVTLGRPNAMEGGPLVPRAALLGLQSVGRGWRSWSETYFVMAMLTVSGLARLFPATGAASADTLLDLGAMLGDGPTHSLCDHVSAAWEPQRIANLLDRWLAHRLENTRPPADFTRMAASYELIKAGRQIQTIASATGVTRRQLSRWFDRHTGLAPKQLMDLERLQSSLRALQQKRGDALAGFSDQSHQIRCWQKRLGMTPRTYSRNTASEMAHHFGCSTDAPMFYL